MLVDNTALAKFIQSLGSLNNYGSSVYQTKKALDLKSTKPLRQNVDDIAIFVDSVKGINAIKKKGFSVDGIIEVNKQFDSPSDEQPILPGHLRNSYYNEDDRIAIVIDQASQEYYVPKEIVTREDLQEIVDQFNKSEKTEKDAWLIFARLTKLQAFQDGNKRTALITANAAYGALDTESYLMIPFHDIKRLEFTISLISFYRAKNAIEEQEAFERLYQTLPSKKEREIYLRQPINEPNHSQDMSTYRIKSELRSKEDGYKSEE
jgi:hypothetical protein